MSKKEERGSTVFSVKQLLRCLSALVRDEVQFQYQFPEEGWFPVQRYVSMQYGFFELPADDIVFLVIFYEEN